MSGFKRCSAADGFRWCLHCSSTVEEYMAEIEKLARELLELLTEGLGLEADRFNHYVENERMMSMRFNLYPPCPQPELAIGLRAHTDPHLLTILHQDEVAGLQVQIDNQWITVKPRPDCFVVNVGDLFQVPALSPFLSSHFCATIMLTFGGLRLV